MNAISRDSGSVKVLGVDNQAKEFNAVKEDIGVVLDEAYFPEVLTPKHVGKVMKNTYRNWMIPVITIFWRDSSCRDESI